MSVMADITETATGARVGVPASRTEAKLLKASPYWRAYFFRRGQGLRVKDISEEALKAAKEGDYRLSLMDRGKVIWEG
jgi:hypothetical protein